MLWFTRKVLRSDDGTVHCVERVCTAALSRYILGWKHSRSTQLSASSFLINSSRVFRLNALTAVVWIGGQEKRATTHRSHARSSAFAHTFTHAHTHTLSL